MRTISIRVSDAFAHTHRDGGVTDRIAIGMQAHSIDPSR